MEVYEFRGPFRKDEEIGRIPASVNNTLVQIGVQIPERDTIFYTQKLRPDVVINDKEFVLHDRWMVEFSDIKVASFTIVARKDLPAETIIDVMTDIKRE